MLLGWIEGIDAMRSAVLSKTLDLAQWMLPDYSSSVNSNNGVGFGGGITQNIRINSPNPTSPSDNARKMKQAARQMAMEWGV